MWRHPRVIALCLLVGLVSTGCSSTWSDLGSLGGPDVAALRVTGQRPVDAQGPVRMSPDGTRLLRLNDGPCVTAVDGGAERCVDRDTVSGDLLRGEWSPDGTRLVFTDDFWRQVREPDVWVFDVTDGSLDNLTDDGVDKFNLGEPNPEADMDLLPSWSPDGEVIRFARGHWKAESMELMTIDAGGGEASSQGEIRCGSAELVGLAWSAERVAWTCGAREPSVWMADHSGEEATEVLPGKKGEDRMALSFSPTGGWLLVDSLGQYAQFSGEAGGLARVVPVDGGKPVPVAEGEVAYPTWAPGGQALAYVEGPGTLKVVAEPGGRPRELHSAERLAAADTIRLAWAPDALLVQVEGEPVRLTLED